MFNGHNNANDRAEKLADEAEKNLRDWGREAHHYAENAKSDMVKTLYDSAKNLRKEARDAGASDDALHRVDDVATGFEKAASYLKGHTYGDMGEDAVKTVKRYPLQTMAILFVVGVVIGLLLRGDSSQRR
ncbi:MAG TPA: hypothetical protein VHD90_26570 [Phototrophicaceae bacterium]|nr:hypothetical protein [Phototrophicaceae bacterium]